MPEQHRTYACDAEDQREGDEVPLLAQEIDIRITKKFHEKPQVSMFQSFMVSKFLTLLLKL
jgi:hypothetical protein